MEGDVRTQCEYWVQLVSELHSEIVNPNSRRKIKSSRNMNFLGTNRARLNPCKEKEGLAWVISRERVQAAVVAVEGGVEVVDVVDVVDVEEEAETEVGMPVTGLPKTRTKPRGAITTGNEVMTRRWQRQGHHLRSMIIHWYAVEL